MSNPQNTFYRNGSILPFLLGLALMLSPAESYAAGTAAGTNVSSQASVNYELDGMPGPPVMTASSFLVDRTVNLSAVAVNGSYVTASAGSAGRVLTFTVTNTGNDVHDFSLAPSHGADPFGGIDNFDALNAQVFVENGASPGYQASEDTLNFIDELAADGVRAVYIVADIPAGQTNGDISALTLTATARSGGNAGVPGAVLTETAGSGDVGTVDTVFADASGDTDGGRDASHSDTSAFQVGGVILSLVKSAVVIDPFGGNRAQAGATIRYTVDVTATGSGTATGVVFTDPVPANTTYNAGTLSLNGTGLTDGVDGDAGEAAAGAITVRLPDLTAASPAQTITFEVTID